MIRIAGKRKGLYLLLVIFLTFLSSLSLYYLFTPVDLTPYKGYILPRAEEAIHAKIEMEGITITVLPYPRLSLNNIAVSENGNLLLKAASVKASLFMKPLILKRKIEVKNLLIGGPELFVRRETDGGFNIVRILRQAFAPGVEKVLSIQKATIQDGTAHVLDEVGRYEAVNIEATFIPGGDSDFLYSGSLKVLPSTTVKFSGETQNMMRNIAGEADIHGFNISQGWPYLKDFLPGKVWKGNVDASLSYWVRETASDGRTLSIKANANYRGLAASVPFLFDKPVISSNGTVHIQMLSGVKELSIKADVNYHGLTASASSLFNKPIVSSAGTIYMDILSSPDILTVSVPKAKINLPEFAVSADMMFERPKDSRGKMILNLDTTTMPLASLKEQFFIPILPKKMQEALNSTSFHGGHIKISSLKLAGNIKDLEREDYYKTANSLLFAAEARDAEFTNEGLGHQVSAAGGTIIWRDGNLTLEGIKGRYGNSSIEKLDGKIYNVLDVPSLSMKGNTFMDAKEMLDEFKKWFDKKMLFKQNMGKIIADGNFPLSFAVSGRTDALDLSISLDATPVDIGYQSWFEKRRGFYTGVDASMLLSKGRIAIEKGKISFGVSTVEVNGILSPDQVMSYKFNVKGEDLRLDDMDSVVPYLKSEFASRGNLSINLGIEKKDQEKPLRVRGVIQLRDGEFETKLLPKKVSGVNISSRFSGNSARVIIKGMKVGDSMFSGSIDIPDIAANDIVFNLVSPHLDDEDIYKADGNVGGMAIPVAGRGRLSIKEAKIRNFHIKSLQSDAVIKPDAIIIDSAFISHNGRIASNFIYSKKAEDPFLWRLNLKASEIELESLIEEMGASEKVLSGDIDVKLELVAGKGGGELPKRIDGKGNIYSRHGRLWKFVILSKIFSLVNIVSIDELFRDGLPYRTVTGDFVIKEGIITTENLSLDSDSMRMSMIGTTDLSSMNIDAKLGLHPFVTVDKIITKIPLAGWIIGGKEKTTISMYYTIKGQLKNPEIEAIPIQALGEGVWGIFKRILRLPVDILEPSPE